MRNLATTMVNKVLPKHLQTKFKAGDTILNWSTGCDDVELKIMAVIPLKKTPYLCKVIRSPEYKEGEQFWGHNDFFDMNFDTKEEVIQWKEELGL